MSNDQLWSVMIGLFICIIYQAISIFLLKRENKKLSKMLDFRIDQVFRLIKTYQMLTQKVNGMTDKYL